MGFEMWYVCVKLRFVLSIHIPASKPLNPIHVRPTHPWGRHVGGGNYSGVDTPPGCRLRNWGVSKIVWGIYVAELQENVQVSRKTVEVVQCT